MLGETYSDRYKNGSACSSDLPQTHRFVRTEAWPPGTLRQRAPKATATDDGHVRQRYPALLCLQSVLGEAVKIKNGANTVQRASTALKRVQLRAAPQRCEIWMSRLAGQRCSSRGRECGTAERETRAFLKRTCTDISDEECQPFHFLHIGVSLALLDRNRHVAPFQNYVKVKKTPKKNGNGRTTLMFRWGTTNAQSGSSQCKKHGGGKNKPNCKGLCTKHGGGT